MFRRPVSFNKYLYPLSKNNRPIWPSVPFRPVFLIRRTACVVYRIRQLAFTQPLATRRLRYVDPTVPFIRIRIRWKTACCRIQLIISRLNSSTREECPVKQTLEPPGEYYYLIFYRLVGGSRADWKSLKWSWLITFYVIFDFSRNIYQICFCLFIY